MEQKKATFPQPSETSASNKEHEIILDIKDLSVVFPIFGGIFLTKVAEVKAVDHVDLQIRKGEVMGLVGESGSGKTTLGKAVMNILKMVEPNTIVNGVVDYKADGKTVNFLSLSGAELKSYRKKIQMIFQDPYSSLNSRILVKDIIREPLDIHYPDMPSSEKDQKVASMLSKVGLLPDHGNRYPHEFSGGQRQRIGIARALIIQPDIIIADESVSALDVSVQAQILNLLQDLQEEFKLTLIFIAHDLSVVNHLSNRIAVMYLGDVIEVGTADEVYSNPRHPYTKSLISAIPSNTGKRIILKGEIPSPLNKPSGCGFRQRCPIARPECANAKPQLKSHESGTDSIWACPFWKDMDNFEQKGYQSEE